MKHGTRSLVENERGGVLVLVAVSLVALLAMMALAIDLSMAFTARSEAQRVADSAALAGASAFLDYKQADAKPFAEARAYEYAVMNDVRKVPVDSSEVVVQVDVPNYLVRVFITRQALPTWFAHFFGVTNVDVGAHAAAKAVDAGAAKCLKPFAIADGWSDADDDLNGNRIQDDDEAWEWGSDPFDRYERYTGGNSLSETGYGSQWRNGAPPGLAGDYGRPMQIKVSDPNSNYAWGPGFFFPWSIPPDPNMEDCDQGGGGSQSTGGATYKKNICSCNGSAIVLGQEYLIEPGNMIGPTYQGIDELMSDDSGAYWDPTGGPNGQGAVAGSMYGNNWISSPRVIKVALFDPSTITDPGRQPIVFNNFALMFLEGQGSPQQPVTARFLYYASGDVGPGPETGSLVRVLRLVE